MIEFQCRKCKQWMKVPNDQAGERVKCEECGRFNQVPIVPTKVELVGCGLWCLIVIAVASGLAILGGLIALLNHGRL